MTINILNKIHIIDNVLNTPDMTGNVECPTYDH